MIKSVLSVSVLFATLAFATLLNAAETKAQQKPPHGSQLLTEQERTEFHEKLRAAKTPEERERISKEQHKLMRERMEEHKKQMRDNQLITRQERAEFHKKMRAAKTPEEREQIRMEQHKLMQERARAKGIKIPDEPPMHGGGTGPGMMNQGGGSGGKDR